MEVNRINGTGYQAPPPPMPGSGEFAPAPEGQAYVEVTKSEPVQQATPAVTVDDVRAERAERKERGDALQRAVSEINSSIAIHHRHLGVRFHQATNRRIVTVYDSDTNEVIREIPPEKVLEAHASMLEMVGLFVDKRG